MPGASALGRELARQPMEDSSRIDQLRHGAHALIQARRWDEVEALLTDLCFLEAKAGAGLAFELAEDFAAASQHLPEARPARRLLALLEEALRRDLHFIARHPATLFQCLWNSCWWYDCPQAAPYYDSPPGGWPHAGPPWAQQPRLSTLLEAWRREKEERSPGFAWLRSLRPPNFPLGGPQRLVLPVDTDHWRIRNLAFSPNGLRLFAWLLQAGTAAPGDPVLRAWDVRTGREVDQPAEGGLPSRDSCLSPDGRWRLQFGGPEGGWGLPVRLLDVSGEEVAALPTDEDVNIGSVAFSHDSQRCAGAGWGSEGEGHVMVWDLSAPRRIAWLQSNQSAFAVGLSSDGSQAAVGDSDGTITLWDVQTGNKLVDLEGHECVVQALAFSADSQRLASVGHDGAVRVWDLQRGQPAPRLKGHPDSIVDLTFNTTGTRLVSVSVNSTTWLWDGQTGAPVACPHDDTGVMLVGGAPRNGVFADEKWIISLGCGGIWDAVSGSVSNAGPDGEQFYPLYSSSEIAWSSDGQRFVTFGRSHDSQLRVCVPGQADLVVVLQGHQGEVNAAAFSRCGRLLVSGSEDRSVRVWDARTGAQLTLLAGHAGAVSCVTFSPDGRQVVSGAADGTVRIWDAQGGPELARLRIDEPGVWRSSWSSDGGTSETHAVSEVAFSRIGARVLTLSSDDRIRVWAPASGACLETIEGKTDFRAVAAGAPWRALGRGGEVQVESAGGAAVARMPLPRSLISGQGPVSHPAWRTWAWALGKRLYLFTLEAGSARQPNQVRFR